MSSKNDIRTDASDSRSQADLQTVLEAWNAATLRLQKTHEALQAEVRRLTEELEIKNRELARKNRLADLGQMASLVAHEVRNNLMPLTLYLSLLRRRIAADEESVGILDRLEAAFRAVERMVGDLLHFATDRRPELQRVSVEQLFAELIDGLIPQLVAQGIQVEFDVEPGIALAADCDLLRRAIMNLLLNALDAMPRGGRLTLVARCLEAVVELAVKDTGPGLPPEVARRAFEPFFTTKPGGTGLGLAIVLRVAEAHGGSVIGENAPEGGAIFRLRIPRQSQNDRLEVKAIKQQK